MAMSASPRHQSAFVKPGVSVCPPDTLRGDAKGPEIGDERVGLAALGRDSHSYLHEARRSARFGARVSPGKQRVPGEPAAASVVAAS